MRDTVECAIFGAMPQAAAILAKLR
ncbi:MAG: hypothetical protein JWM16_4421, partial [Verrucomicrobiales bacterium]|nr:hypothetical protein [Verrucomicrobiales bacterium]